MGNKPKYEPKYLGDGAYIERNEWGEICLYAANGIKRTNEVFLSNEMLEEAAKWAKEHN